MSDTPRTEFLWATHDEASEWVERSVGYMELLDFARQLERELAAANARIEAAEALLRYYDIDKVKAYFKGDIGKEPWREHIAKLEQEIEEIHATGGTSFARLAAANARIAELEKTIRALVELVGKSNARHSRLDYIPSIDG